MKHIIRPAAREDILRQYRYYAVENKSPASGERFLAATQAAIQQVCKRPSIGLPKTLPNGALEGLRSWPLKRFPAIRIYYLVADQTARILRVLHGRRDVDPLLEDIDIAD